MLECSLYTLSKVKLFTKFDESEPFVALLFSHSTTIYNINI